jgi:predicted chitinase
MPNLLQAADGILTREAYRNETDGWRLDTNLATDALGTLDGEIDDVLQTVKSAAAQHKADGYVAGPELDYLFDGLQSFEAPSDAGPDGNNLLLVKGGAQLQVYQRMNQILGALDAAWVPDVELVPPVLAGNDALIASKILARVPADMRKHAKLSVPLLVQECSACGITMPAQIAYVMATVQRESRFGLWMTELSSGRQYQGRADLGNLQPGDGVRFKGRGFVQCTGRKNYTYWTKRMNADLPAAVAKPDFVRSPALAAEPGWAAKICTLGMKEGRFTTKKLDDYINAAGIDFLNARRVVNGLDHAQEIMGNAKLYLSALLEA